MKSIAQINSGIGDISDVIRVNSATAEESAASSQKLYGQTDTLKRLVSQFKVQKSDDAYLLKAISEDD